MPEGFNLLDMGGFFLYLCGLHISSNPDTSLISINLPVVSGLIVRLSSAVPAAMYGLFFMCLLSSSLTFVIVVSLFLVDFPFLSLIYILAGLIHR